MIEIGDSEGEVRVWGEINMLRYGGADAVVQHHGLTRTLDGLCVNSGLIRPLEVCALAVHVLECKLTDNYLVRQDKLLKTLMEDIVRSTNQERPLEVKLPLYPFSRSSAFEGINGSNIPSTVIAAPLPPADASDDTEPVVVVPQAQSPSYMVNGQQTNGMHGMNGMNGTNGVHVAQTMGASMQTPSYNSPPQNNGAWHNQYVTPSPPAYASNASSYMH